MSKTVSTREPYFMVRTTTKCDIFVEISLTKYTSVCRLTNLFMDPTGNHLLISFVSRSSDSVPELVYLSRKSNKLRSTTRFRGQEITEVAWNQVNESDNTTGTILLGVYALLKKFSAMTLELNGKS